MNERAYTHETKTPLSASIDYYKFTMGDVIYEHNPDAEVTFTLKNRSHERPLSQYVTPTALQSRIDTIRARGFSSEEVAYLAGLKAQDGSARFTEEYLDHLADIQLPTVEIGIDPVTSDIAATTTGPWPDVSIWETVVMSEINELYYKNLLEQQGLTLEDLYAEGDRRLDEKMARLREHPTIKFADFGTRRRFSLNWHEHVIGRLSREMPEQFAGTSNPYFAHTYNLAPVGTFAHEMPMVYAALEEAAGGNPLDGHARMIDEWQHHYSGDLSVALADTFGSDVFFAEFNQDSTASWSGLRHDSGDPFVFGEKAITHYMAHGIDPLTKTIVFSDGLDVDTIIKLQTHFEGRVELLFGWGTNLINDLGLTANNFVMKATEVDGHATVKLSDDIGKHTGPEESIERYQSFVEERKSRAGV